MWIFDLHKIISENLRKYGFIYNLTGFDHLETGEVDHLSTLSTKSTINPVDKPAYFLLNRDVLEYNKQQGILVLRQKEGGFGWI